MTIILSAIIVLLLMIIFYQHISKKARDNKLGYVYKKLEDIIKNQSRERILVMTEDKKLIPFLIEINKLLDYKEEVLAKYSKLEMSMRKMLSNISHDLKTPLTVILGYIETIELYNFEDEELKASITEIKAKTVEVMELINKFFDLAKLESGDKDIPIEKININEVLRENILKFYDIITAKGLEVSIELPKEKIYVYGNEEAIERIMNNLISNAIKYGSGGKIIGVQLRHDDKFAYISVWDRGKGINEFEGDKVFERMYTLDDSRNKLNQGSGLGLTITKRLVEKLGGEISLSSIPYERTEFSFNLKRITY